MAEQTALYANALEEDVARLVRHVAQSAPPDLLTLQIVTLGDVPHGCYFAIVGRTAPGLDPQEANRVWRSQLNTLGGVVPNTGGPDGRS